MGRELEFQELSIASQPSTSQPSASHLELRAVRNPGAHPDPHCAGGGYGGPDLPKLLSQPDWLPRFKILGATNGTVFRAQAHAYASNQMLWSKGAGLIAPLRTKGGQHLFVADARGGHDVAIDFKPCSRSRSRSKSKSAKTCVQLLLPGKPGAPASRRHRLPIDQVERALLAAYPSATLILQSNMPLMPQRGKRTHWTACPAQNPGDWRCASLARTVLCAKRGGGISLLTTPAALPLELAAGLKRGGACHTDCDAFYNLDGGGSTQMAWLAGNTPKSAPGDVAAFRFSGRRIETSQPGCSPMRPVDNYLVIGAPGP
jgi:hypothetical protein